MWKDSRISGESQTNERTFSFGFKGNSCVFVLVTDEEDILCVWIVCWWCGGFRRLLCGGREIYYGYAKRKHERLLCLIPRPVSRAFESVKGDPPTSRSVSLVLHPPVSTTLASDAAARLPCFAVDVMTTYAQLADISIAKRRIRLTEASLTRPGAQR